MENLREQVRRLECMLSDSCPSSPESPTTNIDKAHTPQRNDSIIDAEIKKHKTRLTGETHWRFAGKELPILKQIMEKSSAFADNRTAFRDVKRYLRAVNAVHTLFDTPFLDSDFLVLLLPEASLCEQWTSRYFDTYGKLFEFIHRKAVSKIKENIQSNLPNVRHTSITLVLLIVAVAMQNDHENRLLGRRVAQHVENFIHSSGLLRTPGIEIFQCLCLLTVIKYITASDTDDFDGMSSVMDQTRQMALRMGLHRDISQIPATNPYKVWLRKRLRSTYFRLALDYSVQSGSHLTLQAEDGEWPAQTNIDWDNLKDDMLASPSLKDLGAMNESLFSNAMCKLATFAASVQQAVCSTVSSSSTESCRNLRQHSQQILTTLPKCLQHGAPDTNGIHVLQRSLIAVMVHRSSLLLSLHLILAKCVPEQYIRTLLFGIWDSSCSILHSVKLVSQDGHTSCIGHQLLWADAFRAIFCAAMVIQKLRFLEMHSPVSAVSHHTILPLQNILSQSLAQMCTWWLQKVQLGPTAAKTYLYLQILSKACASDVGAFCYEDLSAGVRWADEAVEHIRRITIGNESFQQRQHQERSQRQLQSSSFPMLTPPTSDYSQPASTSIPSSPFDFPEILPRNGNIPDWATAATMAGLGMDLGNLQFHPSFTPGSQPRSSQVDFLDEIDRTPTFPSSIPHSQHLLFPLSLQNTPVAYFPRSNSKALRQPITLTPQDSLTSEMDETGMANSWPMDMDSSWGTSI